MRRIRITIVSVAAGMALGGGGYALANGAQHGSIRACANRSTGALRLVRGSHGCRRREQAVSWGKAGPPGPSDGYFSAVGATHVGDHASLKLPPGNYIATGGCTAQNDHRASGSPTTADSGIAELNLTTVNAQLGFEPEQGTEQLSSVPPTGEADLSTSDGFFLPKGKTLVVDCYAEPGVHGFGGSPVPLSFFNVHITAVRVGSLHRQ